MLCLCKSADPGVLGDSTCAGSGSFFLTVNPRSQSEDIVAWNQREARIPQSYSLSSGMSCDDDDDYDDGGKVRTIYDFIRLYILTSFYMIIA